MHSVIEGGAGMISVPIEIVQQFESKLAKHSVPSVQHGYYKKWLRYYLDFCSKYHCADASSKSLPLFLKKLKEKRQTDMQIKQAAHAISLYLDLMTRFNTSRVPAESKALAPVTSAVASLSSDKPAWDKAIADLAAVIKTRHYSPKTLSSYTIWVNKFRGFKKGTHPSSLTTTDVKDFLTHLAVTCNVSPSSQNPQRRKDHDDLYPLRAEQDGKRGKKSLRFLSGPCIKHSGAG